MVELDDSDIPAQDPDAGLNVATAAPPVVMPPAAPMATPVPVAATPPTPVVAPAPVASPIPPGTPLGSSGQPLPPFQRSYTLSHTPQPAPDPYGGLGDVPIAQAKAAIAAAGQYMALRGIQADLAAGKSSADTWAKWGPAYFGAVALKSQPKPNYSFVAGQGGAPPTYQAPGQRPVIVPQSALPKGPGADKLITQEVLPGIIASWLPGSKEVHYERTDRKELTEAQRIAIQSKLPAMGFEASKLAPSTTQPLSPSNPLTSEYSAATNAIAQVRQAVGGAPQRAPVKAPQSGSRRRIKVRSPAGKVGSIPEDQLDDAKAAGYTEVQ